jgi:putative aldouronate transport system permease protein
MYMDSAQVKVQHSKPIVQKPLLLNRLWRAIKKDYILHLMILPSVIGFLLFKYVPMYGMIIAFKQYDIILGFLGSPWVGFDNFIAFFNDIYFFRLIKNTFLLGLNTILWGFPLPIILALLLNELRSSMFRKVSQTVSYLPHFIPIVVVVGVMYNFFGTDGIINDLLESMGVPIQNFVGEPGWFRSLYVGSGIWQMLGWNSIIYLAVLSSLDPSLYEAAKIDGANRWKQMLNVTLPGLIPITAVLFVLNIGTILDVGFEKVFLMYSPAVYETADVLSTYVYRRGIQGLDFSYGTAVDLFNGVVTLIIVLISNYAVKKAGEDGLF